MWGALFHIVARKGDRSTFLLRHPTELQELFNFLSTHPIEVLNCLHLTRSQQRLIRPRPSDSIGDKVIDGDSHGRETRRE